MEYCPLIKPLDFFFNRQKSIRWKILFVIIPLATVPLIILTSSVVYLSGRSLENQLSQANKDIARESSREIRLYLESTTDILVSFSEILGKAKLSNFQKQYAISKIAANTGKFNYINLTDDKGMEVLSSDPEHEFRDINSDPLFLNGKKDLYLSRKITINHYTNIPEINVSVPIIKLNSFEGVLIASVNLRRMWESVNSIKFGKTGMAFLLDHNGVYLSHRNEKYVLKGYVFPDRKMLKSIGDQEIINRRTRNYDGQDVFLSCSYIEPLNLYVVVEKTSAEAFQSVRLIIFISVILLLVLIFFGIWLSFSSTRRIVRPINALVNGFRRVAAGNLDESIMPEGKDEIAFLTVGFNSMISDLKGKREHVSNLLESLKESERLSTIGAVASTVAHEIKKPLSSLKVLASSLKRADSEDERKKILAFIPGEIDRLTRIVDNTLNTVRRPLQKMLPCRLKELLSDLVLLAGDNMNRQKILFSCNISEKDLEVLGSRDQLFQVFLNLVNNSIEAMPDGGEINITAQDVPDSRYVKIAIRDNGPGISEEHLPGIFLPFTTYKKGGTGIGLAIVKRIIKQHRGRIEVASTHGDGTEFTIFLPKITGGSEYENDSNNQSG
jgi:signal transduction histidine kinase